MKRLLPIGEAPGTEDLADKISALVYDYHLNSGQSHDTRASLVTIKILREVQKWMDTPTEPGQKA